MLTTDIGRFFLVIVFVVFVGLVIAVELASAKLEMDRLVLWEQILQEAMQRVPRDGAPPPQSGTVSDMAGWQTYRNEEYGFEFKYPPDLKLIATDFPGDNPHPVLAGLIILVSPSVGIPKLTVALYHNPSRLPVREWYEQTRADQESFPDLRGKTMTESIIGGIPSFRMEVEFSGTTNIRSLVPRDDIAIGIESTVSDGAGANPWDLYDQILSTFRFIR